MEERGVPLRFEYFTNETVQFLKESGQFLDVRITYTSESNSGGYDFVISMEVAKSEERFLGIKVSRIFSAKGSYREQLAKIFSSAGFSFKESGEEGWVFANSANIKIHVKPALSLAKYGFVRCFFIIE
ncbi:MAG TPA: hypothetical protein P5262_03790 [Candidatus Moranbacteria bacterium]|nr:hypothetical protein [Candidatus Moranbacteria bacterium]